MSEDKPQEASVPKQDTITIEEAARQAKAPTWAAASLKARHGWPIGKQITLAEYKKALDALLKGHTEAAAEEGGNT